MKYRNKIAISLIAIMILVPMAAFAMPGDWRVIERNSDDTADIILGVPSHATNTNATLGGVKNSDSAAWYYFGPSLNVISSTTDGYGANYQVDVNAGSIDYRDLNAGDLETRLQSIEATTTSLNAMVSGLTSSIGTLSAFPNLISEIEANLYSTSTSMTVQAASTTNGLMTQQQSDKLDTIATSSIGKSVEGTTIRSNTFPIFKSATVSSGTAVFNLTADGTAGGTALCTTGVIQDSVNLTVNDATSAYQMSWVWSNGNKTLTVTANKLTTANILTGILGQSQANSSTVKLSVWCY